MEEAERELRIDGEALIASAQRYLLWPREQAVLIADLHLGKGEAFRRAGISVPRGGTAQDLARLSGVLTRTAARELMILGDFLHHSGSGGDWRDDWRLWREQHADVRVRVIAGNHDRQLEAVAPDMDIDLIGAELLRAPFRLRHDPVERDAHVIAGHLHPRVGVPGLPGKWHAFWLRPKFTVLPAYSDFTGGYYPSPRQGGEFLACADGHLLAMPASALRR